MMETLTKKQKIAALKYAIGQLRNCSHDFRCDCTKLSRIIEQVVSELESQQANAIALRVQTFIDNIRAHSTHSQLSKKMVLEELEYVLTGKL